MCELWPSIPQALSTRSMARSWPGRPTWYMTSLLPALLERLADAGADLVQDLVPAHALPLPGAARARALERVQDALGVVDLVDGRRPLGAVAAARGRVERVPLELPHAHRVAVDEGEQAAGRLAVEADRRARAGSAARPAAARPSRRTRASRPSGPREGRPAAPSRAGAARSSCQRDPLGRLHVEVLPDEEAEQGQAARPGAAGHPTAPRGSRGAGGGRARARRS